MNRRNSSTRLFDFNRYFLLDSVPFFRYERIAKGMWYARIDKSAKVLRSGFHRGRDFSDQGGDRHLWRYQPSGVGIYGMRIVEMGAARRRPQSPRVPGFVGTSGKQGCFDSFGEKTQQEKSHQKNHPQRNMYGAIQRPYRQCGVFYPPGRKTSSDPGAKTVVQGACGPIPLSGICDPFRSPNSIFGLCEPSQTGTGRMHSVFEPRMANESQGPMDRLE